MLFSWLKRKTQTATDGEIGNRLRPALPSFPGEIGDFTNSADWPSIKVWLDDELDEKLSAFAAHCGQSRSECLRDILFIDLYGWYAYAQLWQDHHGLPKSADETPLLMNFCRTGQRVLAEPKKSYNLRLFVPGTMLAEIKDLASRQETNVSTYVREVVRKTLLGVSR